MVLSIDLGIWRFRVGSVALRLDYGLLLTISRCPKTAYSCFKVFLYTTAWSCWNRHKKDLRMYRQLASPDHDPDL